MIHQRIAPINGLGAYNEQEVQVPDQRYIGPPLTQVSTLCSQAYQLRVFGSLSFAAWADLDSPARSGSHNFLLGNLN